MTCRQFAWVGIPAPSVTVSFLTCLVTQSCLTLWDHLECSLPGSSVHSIFFFFSGKNTGVSCHFPPPWDLPNPGIEPTSPVSPALQVNSLHAEPSGKSITVRVWANYSTSIAYFPQISNENNSHIYLLEWFWGLDELIHDVRWINVAHGEHTLNFSSFLWSKSGQKLLPVTKTEKGTFTVKLRKLKLQGPSFSLC